MKILEKRPLAIILCVMLGGFSFFADFSIQLKLILATLPLLAICAIYLFENLKRGRKTIIVLAFAMLSLSLFLSALWSALFYPSEYYGESSVINAKIYEIDNTKSTTAKIVFKTQTINGKTDKHTFIANIDKDDAVNFRKYDTVTFSADIIELVSYEDGFDGKSFYVSKGYSAQLENFVLIKIHGNDPDKVDSFFKDLQLRISNSLKLRTDFETGAFLSALIVGDKSDLNGNTKLNFARLGISHILALSGMHLAILSLAINFILKRFGVNKRIRMSAMILLVSFYMALTGFSASVVRSGLMLIISSLLYLVSTKSDGITSLFIAVFLIVLFNPTSIYDLSLWLSAFATLGVIVFSEIADRDGKENNSLARKIWTVIKNGCLVSVFAFSATFALTATRFDSFSIVSVITTLIFSFVIQLFIYGGLLLLLIGRFIPFGKLLIAFSEGILWVAEYISSFKLVYVSMNSFAVRLLIVVLTVFFFAFLVFEIKSKRKGIAILLILLVSVFTVAEIDTVHRRYSDDAVYIPTTAGDMMILKSAGNVSSIYSGSETTSAAWNMLDYFADEGLTYVDNFVLASYSHSSIDFINVIVDGIKVDRILVPTPTTDEELGQAEGLSYLLSYYGASLKFYDPLNAVALGEYEYRLFEKSDYKYGESVRNVYEIRDFDKKVVYVSACEYDELSHSAKALLFNSENLIIGTTTSSTKYFFEMHLPNINNIFYYGDRRLTEEAAEYYKEKGASTKSVKTPVDILD